MSENIELLAAKGQYPVAILCNAEGDEFELAALGCVSKERIAELQVRNLGFVGVIALSDGKVCMALAEPIGAHASRAVAREYTAHVQRQKCDA